MKLLDHFEKIIELVKEKGLTDTFFKSARKNLQYVSSFMEITEIQAVFFALILERFGEPISLSEISKIIKVNNIKLIKYLDEIDHLIKPKRLIRGTGRKRIFSTRQTKNPIRNYVVPIEVIDSVRKNEKYECTQYENLTAYQFFESVDKIIDAAIHDLLDIISVQNEVAYILERNKDLLFCKKCKEYDLGECSVLILFVFICYLLFDDKEEVIERSCLIKTLSDLMDSNDLHYVEQRLLSGNHKLIQKELLEYENDQGIADKEKFRLSETMKNEFLSDLDLNKISKSRNRNKNIIYHEKIKEKNLYYSEKVTEQINELHDLIKEENFSDVKKRLAEKGMRTGFCVIFTGTPGTGKTETIYKLAKTTQRDLFFVDIANTKSCWFGESEKKISAIFKQYKEAVEESTDRPCPILVFNECDAVLNKRQVLGNTKSGVDKTENAIQNIILNEMETLEGIMICTSNMMMENFDKAFERRFLYKIEFEKPDLKTKALIWKDMIPELTEEDAQKLAKDFEFSGGQIENISRKYLLHTVLKNEAPNFEKIKSYCNEELLNKTKPTRIGFHT